jgi:hypothetical protein
VVPAGVEWHKGFARLQPCRPQHARGLEQLCFEDECACLRLQLSPPQQLCTYRFIVRSRAKPAGGQRSVACPFCIGSGARWPQVACARPQRPCTSPKLSHEAQWCGERRASPRLLASEGPRLRGRASGPSWPPTGHMRSVSGRLARMGALCGCAGRHGLGRSVRGSPQAADHPAVTHVQARQRCQRPAASLLARGEG